MSRSYKSQLAAILDSNPIARGCRHFPFERSKRKTLCLPSAPNSNVDFTNDLFINNLHRAVDWHRPCFCRCVRRDCEATNGRLCHVGSCRGSGFPLRFGSSRNGNKTRTGRNKKRLAARCSSQHSQIPRLVLPWNVCTENLAGISQENRSFHSMPPPRVFLPSPLQRSSLFSGSIAKLTAMPHDGFFAIQPARG